MQKYAKICAVILLGWFLHMVCIQDHANNYHVVTMNKIAVIFQHEKSTADFWAVLLFGSILKPIRHEPLLLEG